MGAVYLHPRRSQGAAVDPHRHEGAIGRLAPDAGFANGNFKDIAGRITETTRLTAKLAPLKVLEKVEVQATVQTIETTTATTGQAIEERTIRELPLATQNFQQLLTLSSGAQSELNASAQLGRGNARVIVNGQREDNNNYLIEGISA